MNGVNLVPAVDWCGTGTLVLVVMTFTLASNSRPNNTGHNVSYRATSSSGEPLGSLILPDLKSYICLGSAFGTFHGSDA